MHRLRSPLIVLALVVVSPGAARAQGVDAGVSCEPVRAALVETRRALDEAKRTASTAQEEGARCKEELASTSDRATQSAAAATTCQKDREHLCSATSAFVDELSRGQTRGARETGCVAPEQQSNLDAVVSGWTSTSTWLGQLASYESGETDLLPRPRLGTTAPERIVQRLLRDGTRRVMHRRLLVEALRIVAPTAWERQRARGAAALDAWFAEASPLDPEIVLEAQRATDGASGQRGPSLTSALHLVRAFQVVAGCSRPGASGQECGRARQLQTLLESTGALVVRRRIQEIWATECTAVSAEVTAPWLADFPAAHGADDHAWDEVADAAYLKLFGCHLDDASEHRPFGPWLSAMLPPPSGLSAGRLQRVDAIKSRFDEERPEAACARAVRAMQTMPTPSACALPEPTRARLSEWARGERPPGDAGPALRVCSAYASLSWEGKAASIAVAYARTPAVDDLVTTDTPSVPTAMARLRAHCDERRGEPGVFEPQVASLAEIARGFGEGADGAPFRVDPATNLPLEKVRFDAAQRLEPWLSHVARGTTACDVLGLGDARCRACEAVGDGAAYDCALAGRLEATWTARSRTLSSALVALLVVGLVAAWSQRFRRARLVYGDWAREASAFFDGIGLAAKRDGARGLLPSRFDTVILSLPASPAWERWGTKAAVVRSPPGLRLQERDVNHAAFVAKRLGTSVVLLEHDDAASPDLSAVRAMLEWAAKGGSRAVTILPIGVDRVRWSKSAHDVLDIVEESSLRGNPFDVRGRITQSTQFFNRERLVSGLLAAAHAGHWTVVTGLRRFGKSSLVLEIARRLPGPSAYVDLAGFDHEIRTEGDPSASATTILRYVCLRLVESARARWPAAPMPEPPRPDEAIDAARLTLFFRELSRASREAAGRTAPVLVVLDEIEQALAVSPEGLGRALDVLSIVIGRLKSAVGDVAMPDGGTPIGVFLASALHPLLWAPLRTLAHQSMMSAFQRVCVPCLGEEAASTMLRSLGARQGIRFTDAALAKVVEASQGIPLLLRRIGASVLELYDPERARQGGLGAVEIGVEGASEAIEREESEGAPARVWIEGEIAPRGTVAGAVLRRLAGADVVSARELRALVEDLIRRDFTSSGVFATLDADELARRAEEAAHVTLSLLDETGLLVPHGDLTAPDGYALPDGALRRVLAERESVSAFPSARREP